MHIACADAYIVFISVETLFKQCSLRAFVGGSSATAVLCYTWKRAVYGPGVPNIAGRPSITRFG